jgi:hypothetical protein
MQAPTSERADEGDGVILKNPAVRQSRRTISAQDAVMRYRRM